MTGITAAALAARLNRSENQTLTLLRELKAAGHATHRAGRWRLTKAAEAKWGRALRDMGPA